MKKLTAIVLALAILFGMSAFSAAAEEEPERADIIFVESEEYLEKLDRDNIPVVSVPGFGEQVYRNLDTEDEEDDTTIFGPAPDLLVPAIFKYAPGLLWGFATKNYELMNEKLCGFLYDVFSDIGCNPDGTMKEGTGGKYDNIAKLEKKFNPQEEENTEEKGGIIETIKGFFKKDAEPVSSEEEKNEPKYGYRNDCYFRFDWRKDMHTLAGELHEYIETVKEMSGSDKVALTAFSQGGCVVMTYLYEYYLNETDPDVRDDIHSVVFICGGMNGVASCADPVSGNISVDSLSFLRYLNMLLGDGFVFDILVKLYNNGTFDKILGIVETYIETSLDSATDPYLISTFGGIPGFFAMMSPERYKDAEEFLFGTKELQEKYAGLLEKNRYYHDEVQPKMTEILENLRADGKNVGIIAEYGLCMAPFTSDNDRMTDCSICTTDESFGATCSDVDGILGLDYKQAKECECGKNHVSADLQIDASTCLYPDITWFGKNLMHDPSSRYWADLIDIILYSDEQITVWDFEDLPQFMENYENRFLVPLTNDGTYAVPFEEKIEAAK